MSLTWGALYISEEEAEYYFPAKSVEEAKALKEKYMFGE